MVSLGQRSCSYLAEVYRENYLQCDRIEVSWRGANLGRYLPYRAEAVLLD
jgi:hypothetical protein